LERAKAAEIAAAQAVALTTAMVENSLISLLFLLRASKARKSIQVPLPQGKLRQHCVNLDFQLDAQKECS